MRKLFLVAALCTSLASAQTLTIEASVKFPSITQTTANLIDLLSQGVQVSFLTPTSQPAATLTKTGGITIHSATPSAVPPLTQVQVATPIPGTTQVVKETYALAKPLDVAQSTSTQLIKAQSIIVKPTDGQAQPLINVMGRQAAWAKAKGLQKKPGGLPPGQLKQLCKKEPNNKLCSSSDTPSQAPKVKGKH